MIGQVGVSFSGTSIPQLHPMITTAKMAVSWIFWLRFFVKCEDVEIVHRYLQSLGTLYITTHWLGVVSDLQKVRQITDPPGDKVKQSQIIT